REAAVMIGYPGLSVDSLDRAYLEMLSEYFNDQDGILFQRLRDKEPLVYACGFSYFLGLQPGILLFYAQCHPDKVNRVVEIIEEEVEKLGSQTISPEEIARLRKKVMGNRIMERETISDKAREAGLSILYGLGLDFESKLEQIIMAATPVEIKKFCGKYFAKQTRVITVVTPPKNSKE
ncbi:MAG: insulinase family protein, partial [Candidatus Omnitrophica bacterium]|nr:insulinase family protein [Candidatus Omnitrophota bacterium]